jgi:nucleotide-binding universal stress UspA family protein
MDRTITLRDQAPAVVRPISSRDRARLADAFARLSERSRYRRFLSPMRALSDEMLDHLTDVDHRDHEALVAIDPSTDRLVGVARYVRSDADPGAAEVAVTVADDWQGRGLGKALLEQLKERAWREGVRRFSALALAENRGALALLSSLGEVERHAGGPEVQLVIELHERPGLGVSLARALREAAAGSLVAVGTLARRALPRQRPPLRPPRPIRIVVVGTDGSPSAARAVAAAVELTGRLGGRLHLVSAHHLHERPAAARRAVEDAATAARAGGLEPAEHVRRDDPAEALIAVAEEVDADLLVVGSRGMSGAGRFLVGSVPDKVSHHAPCSVLIVRTAT